MTTGVVSALHIHPIKSCHRVEVNEVTVVPTGLEGDRQWQVSAGLKPTTQRQEAVMATVQPEIIDGGLRLSAPDQQTIEVEQPQKADSTTGSMISRKVAVGDAGDDAAAWFSRVLGQQVRLYARTPESHLEAPERLELFDQPIAFTDLAPILVTNTASLAWLVERAAEPFDMTRFRPNIVIETDEPFVEDSWARFTIGHCELRYGLVWPRCAVPQVDQESGRRNREPAVVLRTHRHVESEPTLPESQRPVVEGSSIFGIGCAIGPVGSVIRVGDPLNVTQTMTPLLAPPPGLGIRPGSPPPDQ